MFQSILRYNMTVSLFLHDYICAPSHACIFVFVSIGEKADREENGEVELVVYIHMVIARNI